MGAQNPETPLTEGQLIGSYRVVRKLGAGGMGAVYEAVHAQIGKRVAIKVLHAEQSRDKETLARFFNEARAVNIVQHPSLVSIFELGNTADGAAYIVMELLDGESLRARLRRAPSGLGLAALTIARQIATGLAATHEKRIVHRDLKPDNVMLVPDAELPEGERVKILDFGIAKLAVDPGDPEQMSVRTRTGAVLGTPTYMSPEQCRGNVAIGERTDVYALGVMLFELLAGRPPFRSTGFGELVAMHMFDPVPPLGSLAPQTPPEVAQLVERMLAKSAAERPPMSEVAATLERVIAQRGGRARTSETRLAPVAAPAPEVAQVTTLRHATGQQHVPPRRSRRVVVLGGAALLTLTAGAIVLSRRGPPATASATAPARPAPASAPAASAAPRPAESPAPAAPPAPAAQPPAPVTPRTTPARPPGRPHASGAKATPRSKPAAPASPAARPPAASPKFEKVQALD